MKVKEDIQKVMVEETIESQSEYVESTTEGDLSFD